MLVGAHAVLALAHSTLAPCARLSLVNLHATKLSAPAVVISFAHAKGFNYLDYLCTLAKQFGTAFVPELLSGEHVKSLSEEDNPTSSGSYRWFIPSADKSFS